jgi:D-alanyl-D-alanine-carboxypeptidase/D-alanyl-D-alanine-endopeptidase
MRLAWSRLVGSCAVLTLTWCSAAQACGGAADAGADTAAFRRWLEPLASTLIDPRGAPGKATGVLIAVSSPTLRATFGFGATRVGGPAPTGDTVFELGSLTKVVTGLLLALAVEDGSASLTEVIDPAFPAGAPRHQGASISLLDLATHTSGLPNYPGNLHPSSGNPAAGYREQDLADFMASCALPTAPGTRVTYSNLGSGVLGYVLGAKAGARDYEALVQQRVAAPLQLADTVIHLSAAQRARLAQGYAQGRPAPELDIGEPLAGGGALRSTGHDVLRLLESAMEGGRTTPALTAAWARVLEPRRPIPGGTSRIGLQVSVDTVNGETVYSKSGGTPGFSTYLVFSPRRQTAVVLLSNGKDVPAAALKRLGEQVLERAQ